MASGEPPRVYPVPIFFSGDDDDEDGPDVARKGNGKGRGSNLRGRGNERRGDGRGSGHRFSNSDPSRGRERARSRGRGSGRGVSHYRDHRETDKDIKRQFAGAGGFPRGRFQRGRGSSFPKVHSVEEFFMADEQPDVSQDMRQGRGRGRGRLRAFRSETALNQLDMSSTIGAGTRAQTSRKNSDKPDKCLAEGNNPDRQTRREYTLGYRKLTELSKMKDADELVLLIANSRGGFIECLDKHLKVDWLQKILEILSTAINAQTCVSTLRDFLLAIEDALLQRLNGFLGQIMVDQQINDQEQFKNICMLTISFLKSQISLLPSSLGKCYPFVISLKQVINEHGFSDDAITNEFKELDLVMSTIREEREKLRQRMTQKPKSDAAPVFDENSRPPEDFRKLSILPSHEDLNSDKQPFLRPNIEEGKFNDLNHFLDIQFRLLREDYIRPLREGIRNYKAGITAGLNIKKIKDLRLYHNVQVLRPVCTKSGIWYVLQFDREPFQRLNWSASKRLLHGSLVCLSADDFETVVFATVTDRDPKDLVNGQIHVLFENSAELKHNTTYIMAETTAFFEAYRHVLEGLQEIKEPMALQRYIVDCETDINRPKYLADEPLYDFSCILSKPARRERNLFPVLSTKSWPSNKDLSFDTSQMEAMKIALTKELALIQGPPGTGKTYVGLKVAKMLLANRQYWMGEGKTSCPILVVCYTNHALDQFLEGIYSFCRENIVRVGGQSKNTVLEPFLLKNIRIKNRMEKSRPAVLHHGEKDVLQQLHTNKTQIEHASEKIKATDSKIAPILTGVYVDTILSPAHYHSIMKKVSFQNKLKAMEIWLEITTEDQEKEFSLMEKLSDTKKLQKIWRDMILNNITPLSKEEAIAQTNVLKLSLLTRAQLYAAWIEEGIENIQTTSETAVQSTQTTTDRQKKPLKTDILEINRLKTLSLSDRFKKQIDQLYQIELTPKAAGQVTIWLCLDSSKKSKKLVKKVIETSHANRFQTDEDLIEERRLDDEDEDDDFFYNYKSQGRDDSNQKPLDESEWVTVHRDRKIGPKVRKIVSKAPSMKEDEVDNIRDVWNIPTEQRHELYRYWVRKYRNLLRQNIAEYESDYEKAAKKYKEISDLETMEILRDAAVVGMTTTGAAKNRTILQQVKPKIIIVEEAAEVLESHIITTLNDNCQHLILIGDHKQLRPNPTVFDLAKTYKLDVSLFERLVRNGLPCVTLAEQHRMRPEISVLMRHEHLYPKLKDHSSVNLYDIVHGVENSVCFIDHSETEQQSPESTSYFNQFEAQYLAALCRYLLQQGYTAEQITVLSPYMGQVLVLRKEMPKPEFEGVRITAVDNFQGEENDIILLSLVRSSNEDERFSKRNPIGFLGIENRVCVALSRAKMGLYVMGNFSLLAASNDMWRYMVDTMKSSNRLKSSLTLHCQNHRESSIIASKPDDFKDAPEGGCKRSCDFLLKCGHVCRRYCHIIDRDHEMYKCLKPCANINPCGHPCKKKCFDECFPCEELVKKVVPMCGHFAVMQCHKDPSELFCYSNCNVKLSCGHDCARKCGDCVKTKQHRLLCQRKVERTWPCGHLVTTECCNGPDTIPCPEPCRIILDCKHTCTGTCGECLEGRLHKSCTSTCKRILPCGHYCSHNCSEICPPCNRPCDWICLHGAKCRNKCYEECHKCIESCAVKCKHKKCERACHEECENFKCDEACDKKLKCGHLCAGLCGEKCPQHCGECDSERFDDPHSKIVQLKDCKCIVTVSDLDRHMEHSFKDSDVRLAPIYKCPKCNKQIVKTANRYTNFIKKRRSLISKRYLVLRGTEEERKQKSKILQGKVGQLFKMGLRQKDADFLSSAIKEERFGSLHNASRIIEIMEDLLKLCQEIYNERANSNNKNVNYVAAQVDKVGKTVMVKRKSVTSQFWNEAKEEIKELRSWLYSSEDVRVRKPAFGNRRAKTKDVRIEASKTTEEPKETEEKFADDDDAGIIEDPEHISVDTVDDSELNEIQLASDEIVVASDDVD